MQVGDLITRAQRWGEDNVWIIEGVYEDFVSLKLDISYDPQDAKTMQYLSYSSRNHKTRINADYPSKKWHLLSSPGPKPLSIGSKVRTNRFRRSDQGPTTGIIKGHYKIAAASYTAIGVEEREISYQYLVMLDDDKYIYQLRQGDVTPIISPGQIWKSLNDVCGE